MIDICDFAVGLSRQLYGLTIASERPGHRMMEQWLPLGPVGVITAFNFPVAVWTWNAALALVCGDPVVWKPSEKTPLTAIACMKIAADVLKEMPDVPPAVLSVVIGKADVGQALAAARSCRWSAPPARRAWARRSPRPSPSGSVDACSSSAATTR